MPPALIVYCAIISPCAPLSDPMKYDRIQAKGGERYALKRRLYPGCPFMYICIEEHTGLRHACFFIDAGLTSAAQWTGEVTSPPDYQEELLKKYDNDTLIYHVHYCIDSELAVPREGRDDYKIEICDLSPTGHELLGKIRDTNQWRSVKNGISAVRNYSLSAISSVAEGVTSAAISAYLQK